MKRFPFVLLLALLALGATPFQLRNVLDRAVTNEREAVIRYEAFAQKATEEGYPAAATLFRAAAKAEAVHAERFAKAMKERGIEVPAPPAGYVPTVGSTGDNLRASASAETQERDGIYHDAIAAAKDAKDEELAKIFDQTRDTEVEHANLMAAGGRQLEKMKSEKTFYVCDVCGYTSDLDLPMCVLCRRNHKPDEIH